MSGRRCGKGLIVATPRLRDSGRMEGWGHSLPGVIVALFLLLAASSLHAQVQRMKKAMEPKPNVAEAVAGLLSGTGAGCEFECAAGAGIDLDG